MIKIQPSQLDWTAYLYPNYLDHFPQEAFSYFFKKVSKKNDDVEIALIKWSDS